MGIQNTKFGVSNGANYLKCDGRTGEFKVKNGEEEVCFKSLKAILDSDNIDAGWFSFPPGQAPNFAPGDPDDPPDDSHKYGIRVRLKGDELIEEIGELLGEQQ